MSGSYRLTPKADQDLVEIWKFSFHNWGLIQANDYLKLLDSQFEKLAVQPGIGKSCDHIRHGYRVHHIKRHLIFYRSTDGVIEIVRILHDRRNIEDHF